MIAFRLPSASGPGQAGSGHLLVAGWVVEDTADLPDLDVPAAEAVEDLRAALEQFREIAEVLGE